MNSHFCKVGKISQSLDSASKLKDLEYKYSNFIEEAYNVKQTDMSLSDILFYEAHQLKLKILNLKNTNSIDLNAAF